MVSGRHGHWWCHDWHAVLVAGVFTQATTGLTAQAWGASNKDQLAAQFVQGVMLALMFGLLAIILHVPIATIIFHFSAASNEVKYYDNLYFSIRIFGAPAALTNLVIMGWLLGLQNNHQSMTIVIFANVVNIVLDLLFVFVFHWQTAGVASATVIAEYTSCAMDLWFVRRLWRQQTLPPWSFIGGEWRNKT